MAKSTSLLKIIEDMKEDVISLEKNWTICTKEICLEETPKIIEQAITNFYGSYSPSIYDRLNLLNRNYRVDVRAFKDVVSISVVYAEQGGGYPDLDEPRWNGHKIWHGQSANVVHTYNWEQGSHGKVQTTPIKEIVENTLQQAVVEWEQKGYQKAIHKPYRILHFS